MSGCDQTYVPEDHAGRGSVVDVGAAEGAAADGGGDGRGRRDGIRRLAEEIGDAPHNVHRLRPEPTSSSRSSASPPAASKPRGFESNPKWDLDVEWRWRGGAGIADRVGRDRERPKFLRSRVCARGVHAARASSFAYV